MSSSPRRPGVFQEEDRVSGRQILLVLLVTGLLTWGGIWWATRLGRPVSPLGAERSPPRTEDVRETREVGSVLVTLIGVDSSTAMVRAARRHGLESWGWIDADSGWVEIPIDAAMAVVAEESRRAAAIDTTAGDTTTGGMSAGDTAAASTVGGQP